MLFAVAEFETQRHIDLQRQGAKIQQETRGYDVSTGHTFKLRSKEEARDYRYMPEPDLPVLILSDDLLQHCQMVVDSASLPDLIRQRLMTASGLTPSQARVLMEEPGGVSYFERVARGRDSSLALSWITSELMGGIHAQGQTLESTTVRPTQLASLIDLISAGVISGRMGKDVLELMIKGDTRLAATIVEEHGWRKISDSSELETLITEIVLANPDRVAKIKQGKDKILGSLVGEIMKKTKGRADPQLVNDLLKKAIGK